MQSRVLKIVKLSLFLLVLSTVSRAQPNNPLIVQGPGAGPEVTAAGVFSDLLRVAASLGARL